MYTDSFIKIFSDQRLIFAVTVLLSVFVAYRVSILVWQLVPAPGLEQYAMEISEVRATKSEKSLSARQKTAEIANKNLFGAAEQISRAAPQPIQDAPKSTLRYKLRGIYYSSDLALASVILEKSPNDSQFYRLGDEVDSKIFIEQIHADHIIISRNGRLEKLIMEKPTPEMDPASRQTVALGAPSAQASQVLSSYRRRYKDNPMALARRFQALPVEENGKNIGYKLKALRGEQLLERIGLQEDDVFLEINGIGLDKPFQALDALKSLTTTESVALTIMRNGSRQTLDFSLQ